MQASANEKAEYSMLTQITPVVLTCDEEPNIARTLSRLVWANDIVVVDSGSRDGTLPLIAGFPKVRVFNRVFDTHAGQWRYAVEETGIKTEWILRLDADYVLSEAFIGELERLDLNGCVSAYRVGFDYAIFSQKLLSSLYPANTILLRKGYFAVRDKGHTEVWEVNGRIGNISARIIHDDWKPISRWVSSQARYMQRERDRLRDNDEGLVGWLRRKPPLMPIAVFLYCLFGKGLILNGRAGLFYALQRGLAETVLALLVIEEKLRRRTARSALDVEK
jgi:glycosyltransferase involved in cell wall biosynthesis